LLLLFYWFRFDIVIAISLLLLLLLLFDYLALYRLDRKYIHNFSHSYSYAMRCNAMKTIYSLNRRKTKDEEENTEQNEYWIKVLATNFYCINERRPLLLLLFFILHIVIRDFN
jgi:hypothetical protein